MDVSEAPALKASTGNVSASVGLSLDVNRQVAGKLREYSGLLRQQGESGFRSRAYDRAADVIGALERPVDEIFSRKGREGLIELPAVGPGIAGALTEILTSGRWSQLDRLRGDSAPEALFRTYQESDQRLPDAWSNRPELKPSRIWSTRCTSAGLQWQALANAERI